MENKELAQVLADNKNGIYTTMLIMLGAVVHATANLKIAKEKGEIMTKADFFILLPIATFSGVMFGLGTKILTSNPDIVMIAAGAGAFLGLAGLNRISALILETLIQRAMLSKTNEEQGKKK